MFYNVDLGHTFIGFILSKTVQRINLPFVILLLRVDYGHLWTEVDWKNRNPCYTTRLCLRKGVEFRLLHSHWQIKGKTPTMFWSLHLIKKLSSWVLFLIHVGNLFLFCSRDASLSLLVIQEHLPNSYPSGMGKYLEAISNCLSNMQNLHR